MEVPTKLVEGFKKYLDPSFQAHEQGVPFIGEDDTLVYRMIGGWQDEPWQVHIHRAEKGYDVTLWNDTDSVFDSKATYQNDEASAKRLLAWIEAEPITL